MSAATKIDLTSKGHDRSKFEIDRKLDSAHSSALFALQSSVLDTVLSDQDSTEKLAAMLETIKNAFDLNAVAFLSVMDDGDVTFQCTDRKVSRSALFAAFSHFDDKSVSGSVDLNTLPGAEQLDYQNAWFQFVSNDPESRLTSGVVVGFLRSERHPTPYDLTALGAITPSFRLLLDAINSDHQLDVANDRFQSYDY